MERLHNIHPGEVLRTEFLEPLDITMYRLARDIEVQATRIKEIVDGKRSVTADTAIRLGRYFQMTPQFWLNLQTAYDLEEQTFSKHTGSYNRIQPCSISAEKEFSAM